MLTYVVNMISAVERRQRMQAILDNLQIEHSFIEAISGCDLSHDELTKFRFREEMKLSKREIGCMLSHVKCWGLFLQTNEESVLILEDDIYFSENFKTCLASLQVPLEERCIIRLETMLATVTSMRKPIQRIDQYTVNKILTNHGGAAAYVINRKTASLLVDEYRNMKHGLDIELFSPELQNILPITVYQFIPGLCIQDYTINYEAGTETDTLFLQSSLSGDRADELEGLRALAIRKNFATRVKVILRPLHRQILSLSMFFKGRKRVKVRYS